MSHVIEKQQQDPPGTLAEMKPTPDHGEESYRGHGRLEGKIAVITGGDSGIGRAVAIAFAREGADVVISYLDEDEDARSTGELVEQAGRQSVLVPGDIAEAEQCRSIVSRTVDAFGRIDVLVNNAAYQRSYEQLEDIPDDEWETHLRTNVTAMFHLCKAAVPHMQEGGSIINTASVNADQPKPTLLAYATTKGAIVNFSAGLAQLLGPRGIRVNSVLPGPVWTPLIPATMPADQVEGFGENTPLGRPAQPVELAPVYVMLASDESSYISGSAIPVTGGKPVI